VKGDQTHLVNCGANVPDVAAWQAAVIWIVDRDEAITGQ
jgi:hypothetical protein